MRLLLLVLTAAPAAASAQEPTDPGSFFREVAKALTCEGLEFEAMQQCGTLPVYQAILQFQGSLPNCQAVVRIMPAVATLLSSYLGENAGCTSLVEKWRYHFAADGKTALYADGEACVQDAREKRFKEFCSLPEPPPGPAM